MLSLKLRYCTVERIHAACVSHFPHASPILNSPSQPIHHNKTRPVPPHTHGRQHRHETPTALRVQRQKKMTILAQASLIRIERDGRSGGIAPHSSATSPCDGLSSKIFHPDAAPSSMQAKSRPVRDLRPRLQGGSPEQSQRERQPSCESGIHPLLPGQYRSSNINIWILDGVLLKFKYSTCNIMDL